MDYKGSLKVICGLLILGATLIANANTTPNVSTLTKYGVGSILDNSLGDTENDIFVTCYNYEGSVINVFYSSNNGIIWTGKEGSDGVNDLPDSPVYSILNNPCEEDEVIVGTELGVQKTLNLTDANPDWSLAYEGMSDVAVLDMNFRETSALDNSVIFETFGRRVYVSEFTSSTNPPVSTTDTITVIEGGMATTTTGGATSVLSNDSDPDGDPITMNLLSTTINGVLTISPSGTGSFTYIHNGSETTTDTFSYRASDGALFGNIVFVTIIVTPFNDCPIVQNAMPDIITSEDAVDKIIDFSAVFLDPEGSFLSYTVTHTNTPLLSASINTTSLTLDYTDNMAGSATVTITANDSGCGTLTEESFLVNVNAVNDLPTGVADTITVDEGGTATTTTGGANSVLSNDTDTDSDPLTVTKLTNPLHHFGGSFSLQSSGTFVYIHDGSETTTDTFNYTLSDGSTSTVVSVTINITPINDCPIYTAVGGFPAASEDGAAWTWNYGAEISDADGNTPLYTLTNTATDLLTAVTAANGIVTFTPKLNQSGSTTMTLNVSDGRGCDIDIEFPVVINPINDCPTLENPTLDKPASEDDPDLVIPLAGIFADVDSPLNYRTTIGNSSLIATSITATALIIDFLPNQSGSTFINLIALDGDLSCTVDDLFTVSITPVNDAPTGVGEVINLVGGASTSVLNDGVTNSVLANDSDPESDAITAVIATGPINGTVALLANGNFTYTHNGSTTATDSFTYTPRDIFLNIGNTTTVTIYINIVPVGVTETIALIEGGTATTTTAASTSVLSNDTDTDSITASLTASIGTSPLFGALVLNANGSFVYTHSGSEDFTDSFTYIPFDGKGYGLPTVGSITITPTNDPPVAFPDSITVGIGQTTSLLTGGSNNVLLNDTDPDGNPLTAELVTGTSSGTLLLNNDGTFSYTQNGVMDAGDSFTYKAKDDGLLDSNTVTVNIALTCSPCTEKTIEAGSSGVIISYRGCDCRKYDAYVPKGEVFIFCHLDGTVVIGSGSYTVLSSKVCY